MRKTVRSIISLILVISTLLCATVPAFAAGTEEYLCDLRIIYADDYDEAMEILEESEFKDYKLLDENLNADTDEDGVWLAYKTTTNIEDAITDMAVMQMGGGYNEGNYQQMIEESYEEYVEMGRLYLDAIEYFVKAYDAGDFLAEAAYRQLNFYNVETQEDAGIEEPSFEGELLGDIFYDGIDENELATMFFEGNIYVLQNIRSLISMGVSYNEDGKTYFEKVADAAAEMIADPDAFDGEDYDTMASFVSLSMSKLHGLLSDLGRYEDELDYTDDEFTELELNYAEIKVIADTMRKIEYLNGQTLYEFMMTYKYDKNDLSPLYPLAAALNEGQIAMTKLAHYHDVLRYSVMTINEEFFNDELEKLEEIYSEEPFNVYTGVDRSIYRGTFALTTAADRADAYSDMDLMDEFLGTKERADGIDLGVTLGLIGFASLVAGGLKHLTEYLHFSNVKDHVMETLDDVANGVANDTIGDTSVTYGAKIDELFFDKFATPDASAGLDVTVEVNVDYSFTEKLTMLQKAGVSDKAITDASNQVATAKSQATSSVSGGFTASAWTTVFYVVGGALMINSALSILSTVYHYYNPEYDDIPIAMVDLIETIDGDRYIKYDVVYEAEAKKDGRYAAGDLNAFEGLRWNALYYTKSYEAGKPLLADEFIVSHSSNQPKKNYAAVHAFGDTVCFDLNRHTFDDDTSIYLSVKQSKNNKAAVADVPEVIGSMFGAGFIFLAGGIGAVVGVGGTVATKSIVTKKKTKAKAEA